MVWEDQLENHEELIHTLALLVVCADGGANRMKDLALTEQEERECVRGPVRECQYLDTHI